MTACYKRFTVFITLVIFAAGTLWACAPTQSNYEGASVGGVVGAAAGALIDTDNPWRGACVGGSLGAVAGARLA